MDIPSWLAGCMALLDAVSRATTHRLLFCCPYIPAAYTIRGSSPVCGGGFGGGWGWGQEEMTVAARCVILRCTMLAKHKASAWATPAASSRPRIALAIQRPSRPPRAGAWQQPTTTHARHPHAWQLLRGTPADAASARPPAAGMRPTRPLQLPSTRAGLCRHAVLVPGWSEDGGVERQCADTGALAAARLPYGVCLPACSVTPGLPVIVPYGDTWGSLPHIHCRLAPADACCTTLSPAAGYLTYRCTSNTTGSHSTAMHSHDACTAQHSTPATPATPTPAPPARATTPLLATCAASWRRTRPSPAPPWSPSGRASWWTT